MSFMLSEPKIKQLCGDIAFKKGKLYFQAGKVNLQNYIKNESIVEASVRGGSLFNVRVKQDTKGKILAACNCPPLVSIHTYCQHIAAVLLYIQEMERQESNKDNHLANQVLGLFNNKLTHTSANQSLFDTREILPVEFTCKPFLTKNDGYLFGIHVNVAHHEICNKPNLKDFLEKMGNGEIYNSFTGFIYNPTLHSFNQPTHTLLNELREIIQHDQYKEEDTLLISPYNWKQLMPILLAAPFVNVVQDGHASKGLQLSSEILPLQFNFEEAKSGDYKLDVKGLHLITILKSYGYVLFNGKMIKLLPEDCKRLAELSEMLEKKGKHQLTIPVEQLDQFMETVTPGLMKLGQVQIAQTISKDLVQYPLRAKLYLDRVKNRLLAGLEFHYGQLVINPFEDIEQQVQYNPTLRREAEREQFIMQIMNDSLFTQTEGGFYMHDEEAEYHFLYHVVPTLEKWVEIYATSTVKLRIHKGYIGPKIRVDLDEKINWLSFTFEIQDIPESDIKKLLSALEEKRKFYKMRNGSLLSLETKEFQKLHEFIKETNSSIEDINGEEIRLSITSGLQWIDSLQEAQIVTKGDALKKLVDNLKNPKDLDYVIPTGLNLILRDYQKTGFQWLKMLAQYKFGGILADDMGLGKTVQSIAYIVSILPEVRQRKQPVLIVSPSSLIYNWMNELKKFAPEIRVSIIDGNKEKRSCILNNISDLDVIITSYPTLRIDAPLYMKHAFHTLFLDEAQAFKNSATQTAKAVKKVKADHRFALTGTPIENSLEELWSIFHVVFPELLPGRKDFNELTRGEVSKRVLPFILRRLKKDVLKELPNKIEIIQMSDLNLEQKKLYTAYLAELKHDALKHLKKGDFQKNRIKILAGLTRLRQLCCHPALFVEGYHGGSAKFDQLMNIIEECQIAGRRVLIFSQFTLMLDIIGRNLGYLGIPFFYLDGQTPPSERVDLCTRFNEGNGDLFLISLKAGGTGLNLTGADTVILYDLWWNPAIEQQAADRAYRMGQKNDVQVIKLVASGTIEEKMNELQEKKKNLIGEILQEGEESFSSITEQDIREILLLQ